MLNELQSQAVTSTARTTIVIAGPGTGKTHTLTHRVLSLINNQHVNPDTILAVTFTNKAAQEMKHRILAIGKNEPHIQTIHAWCYSFLHDTLSHPLTIVEDQQAKQLKKELGEQQYKQYLLENHSVDFDGLITTTYTILKENEELRTAYQNRYRHILIDEFQDLNTEQQKLLLLLSEKTALFIIGDPQQAIYGFRGANTRGFDDVLFLRKECNVVELTLNYRSFQKIIDNAYSLFPSSPRQIAAKKDTGVVYFTACSSEREEAHSIVHTIQHLIGGIRRQDFDKGKVQSFEEGVYTFKDIGILVRNRFQGEAIKQELLKNGLPFDYLVDHEEQYPSVKNALSELATLDPSKLPFNKPLSELLFEILEKHAVPSTLTKPFIKEARSIQADTITESLSMFNELVKIMLYDDFVELNADKIYLLTIHASKGLEWPVVFVPGLVDGIFPFTAGGSYDIEEEKRLLFVAMTRAKKELYLSYPAKRILYGKTYSSLSRFIQDIPQSLLETIEVPIYRAKKRSMQTKLF